MQAEEQEEEFQNDVPDEEGEEGEPIVVVLPDQGDGQVRLGSIKRAVDAASAPRRTRGAHGEEQEYSLMPVLQKTATRIPPQVKRALKPLYDAYPRRAMREVVKVAEKLKTMEALGLVRDEPEYEGEGALVYFTPTYRLLSRCQRTILPPEFMMRAACHKVALELGMDPVDHPDPAVLETVRGRNKERAAAHRRKLKEVSQR